MGIFFKGFFQLVSWKTSLKLMEDEYDRRKNVVGTNRLFLVYIEKFCSSNLQAVGICAETIYPN
jgi:hypothetical protein